MRDDMLAAVPHLRAFAISLCGNRDRADDFVQETLLRALANINTFRPGTNLHGWLFTILRNLVRSDYRKRRREIEDTDGGYLADLKSPPEQHSRLELEEVRAALTKLPSSQREVLLLVGASGFTYEQAAAICEISVGTVKSRVSAAPGAARHRQRRPVRSGPHNAGCFDHGRTGLIGRRAFADDEVAKGARNRSRRGRQLRRLPLELRDVSAHLLARGPDRFNYSIRVRNVCAAPAV
jgi:RNA polymerase sigma-70 factor, ECF subfamily